MRKAYNPFYGFVRSFFSEMMTKTIVLTFKLIILVKSIKYTYLVLVVY